MTKPSYEEPYVDWDVLEQAADYLNHAGGGPMEDRLRLLRSQIEESHRASLARVRGLLQRVSDIACGLSCGGDSDDALAEIKRLTQGAESVPEPNLPNFRQHSVLVGCGAESADIGKLDTADENVTIQADVCGHTWASGDYRTRSCTAPTGHSGSHYEEAGSAETGGEKAAPHRIDLLMKMYNISEFLRDDSEFRLKERLLNIRKVLWEIEPKLNWLDTTVPRSSQNQTVSSGVEGAHEGTTADKSVALAESSLSSPPHQDDE